MSIETGLRSVIANGKRTQPIVGHRVYPAKAPQGMSDDCVVYQQISGAPTYTMDGESGLFGARFQVTCWSGSVAGRRRLANAVRRDVRDATPGTWHDTVVQDCFVENESDMDDIGTEEQGSRYGKALDFQLTYVDTE